MFCNDSLIQIFTIHKAKAPFILKSVKLFPSHSSFSFIKANSSQKKALQIASNSFNTLDRSKKKDVQYT